MYIIHAMIHQNGETTTVIKSRLCSVIPATYLDLAMRKIGPSAFFQLYIFREKLKLYKIYVLRMYFLHLPTLVFLRYLLTNKEITHCLYMTRLPVIKYKLDLALVPKNYLNCAT